MPARSASDAKKRELVGDFKAVGREYEPKGSPVEVRCHDFKDKELGHAIPYGVYDIHANEVACPRRFGPALVRAFVALENGRGRTHDEAQQAYARAGHPQVAGG